MIFDCFKKVDRGEKPVIVITKPEPKPEKEGLNILFLPGHPPLQGANTYIPHYNEAEWNRDVLSALLAIYDGKHNLLATTYRLEGESYSGYSKRIAKFCKENNIDLVIEQHLNAAGIPEARGCEMLIPTGHGESAYYAEPLAVLFSTMFEIVPRGNYNNVKGIKPLKRGARGGGFVHEIIKQTKGKTAAIIMEPFFCDYRTNDSSKFLDEKDYGVAKMVDFYRKYLRVL